MCTATESACVDSKGSKLTYNLEQAISTLSLQLSFMRRVSMRVFWIQNSGVKTLKNTRMPKRRVKLVAKTMQFPVQPLYNLNLEYPNNIRKLCAIVVNFRILIK